MEKPLAVDAPGIRQILAANEEAKKKDLKVVVGLHNRHSLCIRETIRRLKDGAIGPINLLSAYWNVGLLRDTPPRPPGMSEMLCQLRNPYHFLWLSGDYFVDALLHSIDLCCWLKGPTPKPRKARVADRFTCPNPVTRSTTISSSSRSATEASCSLKPAKFRDVGARPAPMLTAPPATPISPKVESKAPLRGGSKARLPAPTRLNSTHL